MFSSNLEPLKIQKFSGPLAPTMVGFGGDTELSKSLQIFFANHFLILNWNPDLVYIQMFRSGIYSEPCRTSMMEYIAKIVNSCSCFRKLFSQYQLFTFSTYFNKNSCFTPVVFIPHKKV